MSTKNLQPASWWNRQESDSSSHRPSWWLPCTSASGSWDQTEMVEIIAMKPEATSWRFFLKVLLVCCTGIWKMFEENFIFLTKSHKFVLISTLKMMMFRFQPFFFHGQSWSHGYRALRGDSWTKKAFHLRLAYLDSKAVDTQGWYISYGSR